MSDRSRLPATIRARVHDGAIDRVSRFFNASVADAAAEIIQNSRRSGATRLDVVTETIPERGTVVTVTDDGFGIADPAVLLSFGESGWDAATARREDPAGMGVYALSKRGCVISSRPATAGIAPMPGWRVQLTPECFLGKQEAGIVACEDAPLPSGTAITFLADQSGEGIRAAFAAAARHCPLAVTVNGEAVARKAFLDGAVHVERWRGLSFGVFDSRFHGFNEPNLNFHGLSLSVFLPTVDTIDGGTWSVLGDVDACPELELVLPARREAVQTPFLDEMRKAARIAIYRAMRRADRTPALAHNHFTAAREAGIDMPIAPAVLRPWRPGIADIDDWRDTPSPEPVRPGTLVMAVDAEIQDQQCFWRAAERDGIAGRLFEADRRLEGYGWYDALARVEGVRIDVTGAGVTHPLDALRAGEEPSADAATAPGLPDTLARPDAIHMHLNIVHRDGPPETIAVPADVAFIGEEGTWVEDAHPLVTRDSDLQPSGLCQLLQAAYFSASDDPDADSHETQRRRFREDATHLAIRLLASEEEARRHTIAEAVWREILWVMPRDREVSIRVAAGKVAVEFGPEIPQPEGAAA
ncbi:MAG: hypothetical protein OXO52_03345 [Rhodospirillales bacterium]|nr:hypothetical protein [Rhodospirillales bacterium]